MKRASERAPHTLPVSNATAYQVYVLGFQVTISDQTIFMSVEPPHDQDLVVIIIIATAVVAAVRTALVEARRALTPHGLKTRQQRVHVLSHSHFTLVASVLDAPLTLKVPPPPPITIPPQSSVYMQERLCTQNKNWGEARSMAPPLLAGPTPLHPPPQEEG